MLDEACIPCRRRRAAGIVCAALATAAGLAPAPTAAARSSRKATPPAAEAGATYGLHPQVRRLAAELAEQHGIGPAWSLAALTRARRVTAVQRLVMPPPPGVAKNWQAYRERFIEPQRIAAGLAFWREHAAPLERAHAQYGVPPEIVVAIVGVETFYGRVTGNYRVIDALATLAFDFPSGRRDRSAFFRDELVQFLLWTHREGLDPLVPRGSYAGAIGLPQFMPSSIVRYGVDYDGDGHVDLRASATDAVGSVAHYLAAFGWQRDLPTHHAVQPPADATARAALLAPDIVPSFSAAQFEALGAQLDEPGRVHDGLLALVELENGGAAPSFVAGTANFYVVTRYNWSSYYAMAVIELAGALKAGR